MRRSSQDNNNENDDDHNEINTTYAKEATHPGNGQGSMKKYNNKKISAIHKKIQ